MKLKTLFRAGAPVISFEFFPPKTPDGEKNLIDTMTQLKELKPAFVSMTYGAGGSTRQNTVRLVSLIKNQVGIEAVAHIACLGHTEAELTQILTELQNAGIENVLALRGDPPKGGVQPGSNLRDFHFAVELVKLIRKSFTFDIGVAGYPEKHIEAPSMQEDLKHLKEKVEAGADVIITQLFFDNRDYFRFVDDVRKLGIQLPIVPGIMPITDVDQIKRFTLMCGAKIPPTLLNQLEEIKADKDRVIDVGIEYATAQCKELLSRGAPGIHFYTLNKSRSTQDIFKRLQLERVI